jgi:hypothetical protein
MECYLATSVFLFFFVGGRRHTRLMSFFVFVLQRVIRFEQSVGSAIDSANSSSPDHSMDLSLFFATSERTRYGQLLGFLVLGRGSVFFLTGNGHWQQCIHVHILLGFAGQLGLVMIRLLNNDQVQPIAVLSAVHCLLASSAPMRGFKFHWEMMSRNNANDPEENGARRLI